MKLRVLVGAAVVAAAAVIAFVVADGGGSDPKLTIYSGREEEIVAPLFTAFTEATGQEVEVRYGQSAEMAAQIAEEGDNTPADVFFSQDAGALGSIANQLTVLPASITDLIPAAYRDAAGKWVGTSGRVRVVAFNTDKYSADDLPDRIADYADPKFRGRIGIAPTNASFQAFVTAMRSSQGEDATKSFLMKLKDNGAKIYEKNGAIMDGILAGEIDLGLVNHYYLALTKAEQPDAPVANKFLRAGDPGSFVNVAGAGILSASDASGPATRFVEFLLSQEGQRFYAEEASENEYPLIAGIEPASGLPPLASLSADSVAIAAIASEAKATLELLAEVGLTS